MAEDLGNWAGALSRAERFSPFLARQMRSFPDITALLERGDVDTAWIAAGNSAPDNANVAATLRIVKRARSLVVAIADLAGAWQLETVTARLSGFADAAIDRALAAAFAERFPGEPVRGLAVLALGKHGSGELNYSSDIDPILLFDPATIPHRNREEPVESAVRLARRMVSLLSDRDADGYVFRVDLRLRPSPDATPIALPVDAAISYYESTARGWEQAAFIRARAAAGDKALGSSFLNAIRPFVWRRSLDFGAIAEITDISRRIRDHYAQGQRLGPGYDLKRGRGGIREVEFFAQIHQLIHGGRNPALRAPATMDALSALAQHDVITDAIYDHLAAATDSSAEHLASDTETLVAQLRTMGFADPTPVAARIAEWREGSARALRSRPALAALEDMLPATLRAIAAAPEPGGAVLRLDGLLRGLPSAINFFRLLSARPGLAEILVEILCHAPALADALGRRASLLDGLIDTTAFNPMPDVATLVREFGRTEPGWGYEAILDGVRQRVGDRRFANGVQIVRGTRDPLDAAAGYARIAEAAVEVLAHATVAEFVETHGRVPGGELAILALGRLGGGLLTHASDLDLVFLFTGDFLAESDGRRPLGATQYFNRLAQRISNALSVATASGPLYEVDTRLRPSGTQGLLAVSFDSFATYQSKDAWAWEHMALTRARPIFGSDTARAELDRIIAATLHAPRDVDQLARDAVHMRGEIARHKPPKGPLDVKLADGGLVDLEFLVHVSQFRSGIGFHPNLDDAIRQLGIQGALPVDLIDAHDLLTRYLVVSRLVSPGADEPSLSSRPLVARACGAASWSELLAKLGAARQSIRDRWHVVADQFKEQNDADNRG